MNWLSLLLVAAIALVTWRAYRTGFVRELVSLGAVILAIPIAGIFYDDMYPKVHPIVDSRLLANLISFLAIFVAVIIGGQVASHLLKRVVAGNGEVLLCGTCMDARGFDDAALMAGAQRSTMDELAAATAEADKVLVF